jgi:four helix bundle protein
MAFRFEDLKVWQTSHRLSNEIDKVAKDFPKIELFSLANQIKKQQIL